MTDDFLDQQRARYEAGDKATVPYCINHCLVNNRPIPPWLATAFREAYEKVHRFEVKSWDDVFDRPLKKGMQIEKERKYMQIARPVFNMIHDRHAEGAAIDTDLFEAVGRELGISGSVARDLYYEILHGMASDD